MLSEAEFYDVVRQALWIATITSLPILSAALVSGVTIGLVQALTSIQEMTLTFVPKLAAIVVVFWMSMSFMSETLVAFFRDVILVAVAGD
ncbi:flagellar biosynthetic protein FliQ [Roseivivax isoporae]|uniref:Flagellar biosynthesis protein FliQ n=1 Tax=Roseivivax isoporae LMG 25204 TaxID=1449351 RepID=X7F9V9_9RHOB|nr:flagellar biosynthetic protein FliQ [Roseivivax isoporae]ETX29692.1 flagellar biosynthesis protein FliQ [Roseivivax isoporae LMG 25204]